MKILFLGAPGSGKSTQGKLLADGLKFEWISSGQLFRESNNPEILKIIGEGKLISDEIVEKMIIEAISNKEDVILDGFPRTLSQCEFLVRERIKLDAIIEIVVPDDELLMRIEHRERSQDDSMEIAKKRIKLYKESRDLIVNFFNRRGVKIVEINGVGDIDEIQLKIREAIK